MKSALPAQKDGPRINEEIRAREVQLIDNTGDNKGVVETQAALAMAVRQRGSISSRSPQIPAPPVAKILDYGKYKFQAQKKAAEARKKQKVVEIKEIKLRPMIDDHDYDVKMRSMKRFFEEGDKVKITLRFRGREMAHQELGYKLLEPRQGRHRDRWPRSNRNRGSRAGRWSCCWRRARRQHASALPFPPAGMEGQRGDRVRRPGK